jgi:hypothetical protein
MVQLVIGKYTNIFNSLVYSIFFGGAALGFELRVSHLLD